eukprot:scaffold24.g2968.t1
MLFVRLCRAAQLPPDSPAQRRGRFPTRRAVAAAARRYSDEDYDYDYDYVDFDEEGDWEDNGTRIAARGGSLVSQALRAVGIVADKLTDVALQVAPQDVPVGVVRTAVNAGLVLLVLGFAKSILGFFLTIGTVVFGAYVAVRVFGLDVAGLSSRDEGGGRGAPARPKQKGGPKRRPDARAWQSEWRGLLGAPNKKRDDGLLDVTWIARKGDKAGGGKADGKKRR